MPDSTCRRLPQAEGMTPAPIPDHDPDAGPDGAPAAHGPDHDPTPQPHSPSRTRNLHHDRSPAPASVPVPARPVRAEPAAATESLRRAGPGTSPGVTVGLADYFDVDPTVVRVGFVALPSWAVSPNRSTWLDGSHFRSRRRPVVAKELLALNESLNPVAGPSTATSTTCSVTSTTSTREDT